MTTHPPWLTWLTIPPTWCGRDTQAMHRTLAHAVDGGPVLWARPDRRLLITQTTAPLDPESIGATSARSLPVRLDYQAGEPVTVTLIANPTVTLGRGAGVRGKRVAAPADRWESWLHRRLSGALTLDRVETELIGQRGGDRHGRRVVHLQVAYTAWGHAADPDQLAERILSGIGAGKAYGCGLLLASDPEAAA